MSRDAVIIVRVPISPDHAESVARRVLPVIAAAVDADGWSAKISASHASASVDDYGTEIIAPHWTIDYRKGGDQP